jgi:predicted transcriptional regulator
LTANAVNTDDTSKIPKTGPVSDGRAHPDMKLNLKVGAAEFEILNFVANHEDATVREVADHFGQLRGWARTTVLKTMDRLRAKGLLSREEKDGVFRYRSSQPKQELQSMLIARFVRDTLGGSMSPFVAYLHGQAEISDRELDSLKQLVAELEARKTS